MELKLFVFAHYAANVAPDNKLVIAGTFNNIDITRRPGTEADELKVVALPLAFLAAVVEASISEGLTHALALSVRDQDGDPVATLELGPMNFVVNPHGRPMRFQAVIQLTGMQLPGPGDYTFELLVDGTKVGETMFYVTDITPQP